MPIDPTIELSCLVFCYEGASNESLLQAMETHPCVKNPIVTDSQSQLQKTLRAAPCDLVVVVLPDISDRLPACLLRFPDLPVLVVVPNRKFGLLAGWLAQGANDIVSSQQEHRLRHTLNTLLNECETRAKLRLANSRFASQYKLQQILLNTYAEAVMLWQNGSVVESNDCFDILIGCKHRESKGRTIEWTRWVSALSHKELHDSELLEYSELTISSTANKHYRMRIESLVLEGGPARLIRINPSPIGLNCIPDLETDSVTGLLVRESFTQRLQSLLQSADAATRYTAILITLPIPENASQFAGVDRTVQDLLVYRAANAIEQHFKGNTLLGRTGINTLLLARPTSIEQSRKLALRVKATLGSLGGLIDDPASVYIKTLTLSPNTLSAIEVMNRLERPFINLGKSTTPGRQKKTAAKLAASVALSLGA